MKLKFIIASILLTACQTSSPAAPSKPLEFDLEHVHVSVYEEHTVLTLTSGSEATVLWNSNKGHGSDNLYHWNKTKSISLGSKDSIVLAEKSKVASF